MTKKRFGNKKLHEVENIESLKDYYFANWSRKKVSKNLVIILGILLVLTAGYMIGKTAKTRTAPIKNSTISLVSKTIGEPMIADINGNINVLLIGFGGLSHRGGFLTDSMMIASFNPKIGTVTMLSIPRDLYVNKDNRYYTRINALLAFKMNQISNYEDETIQEDFAEAAQFLKEKVEEISGLTIPYYVGISFEGFENLIDHFGGLTINVPQTINDRTFPDRNTKGYDPFYIESGIQTLNGYDTLRYARSRHTSSDFGRSYRQQQILSALAEQVRGTIKITQIKKMEELYQKVNDMVMTNIKPDNAIYMAQYKDRIKHFFSYVLTYECLDTYSMMEAGCLLYTPSRADFNNMSVLIPMGASNMNVSFYDRINDFVYIIAHNQAMLIENAPIIVENGIDRSYAASKRNYRSGKADFVATTLKQYGFNIQDITNFDETKEKTTVYTYGDLYPATIKTLKLFMDFEHIPSSNLETGTGNNLTDEPQTGIRIILGNDFIDQLNAKTHRMMR